MIFITGDVHAEADINKFSSKNFPQQKNLTKDDVVIVTGDFGLVWDASSREQYWRKWLCQKNFTTLFVDGNHENFDLLYTYPMVDGFGGQVRKVESSIYHLGRGQVYQLQGKIIYTFGGADSSDKSERKEFVSWWSQERPTSEEMQKGLECFLEHIDEIDMVITHTCPASVFQKIYTPQRMYGYKKHIGPLEEFFEHLCQLLKKRDASGGKPWEWYFGHFHDNVDIDDKFHLLYKEIHEIQ